MLRHYSFLLNHYSVILLFILSVLLLVTSCSTSRKTAVGPLTDINADVLLQKMTEHELEFQTFAARFSASYQEGESRASFSGTLRIHRDSIVWLSFSPAMGIEVMRVAITRDSVKVLDRISKVSVIQDFRYLHRWVNGPLDLGMIQALLTGTCLAYTDGDHSRAYVDKKLYRLDCTRAYPDADSISGPDQAELPQSFQIWLEPENFKVVRTFVKETQGATQTMEASYMDFKLSGEQAIPSEANFLVKDGRHQMELSLRYARVKLNESLTFPFTIPEDYTRVTE